MMVLHFIENLFSRCRARGILMILAPVLGLTGCAGLDVLVPRQPELYVLTPKSTFQENLPVATWQLVIEEPVVAGALNVPRIAALRTPTRLDYLAGAAWAERAPSMVQTLLLESFENSGRITSLGRQVIGLRSDYNLKSELREFQIEYYHKSGPKVRIRLNLMLVQQPRRVIVASKGFEGLVDVDGSSVPEIVNGFDRALGKVLRRAVAWTLIQGNRFKKP